VLNVTADTNVLVSALAYQRGKPQEFLRPALDGKINLTVSQHILNEMADVLARKFDASEEEISEARAVVRKAARTVRPSVQIDVIKDDPADNRILECGVSAGADYIVTGDKDLLRPGSYDSIKILKVSDFLKIAPGQGRPR
jgi:putative PIN family toxin of toxin-antitoxin system